jgi:predicted small lipoprotein YifL
MKHTPNTAAAGHLCRIAAGALLLAALGACGYKGPLYMPKPAPPPDSLTKPPTSTTPPADTSSPTPSSSDAATPSAVK